MGQSPLGEFDDATLTRMRDGLLHAIPGDPTFFANLAALGRALIDFERRYRVEAASAHSGDPGSSPGKTEQTKTRSAAHG